MNNEELFLAQNKFNVSLNVLLSTRRSKLDPVLRTNELTANVMSFDFLASLHCAQTNLPGTELTLTRK